MNSTKLFWRFALLVSVSVPVAVACGGGQTSTSTPPAGSGSASPSVAPVAWDEMEKGAKLAVMKNNVLPKMHGEFATADSKKWGDIGCATCHGEGAKSGGFKMPNPKLPVVNKDNFQQLTKDRPDAMKFMQEKVVPDMAAMLGEAPFDPSTGKGFGCHDCHPSGDAK